MFRITEQDRIQYDPALDTAIGGFLRGRNTTTTTLVGCA
jgi:hypothetical protein